MYKESLAQKLVAKFPEAVIPPIAEKFVRDPAPMVRVPASKLRDVCRFIKTDKEFSMDVPNFMTAVDFIKDNIFELVYYFYSTHTQQGLVLKVHISRTEPVVDSITDLWNGMDFQEREVFDLMGITFTGHPYLKRIMLWEGYPGHPLRKDYVHVTDKYDSGLEVGTPGFDAKGIPTAAEGKHGA